MDSQKQEPKLYNTSKEAKDAYVNQQSTQATKEEQSYMQMSKIEEEEIEWLWYPYIPLKKITIFRGDPGVGKTYFATLVASYISNGWAFPNQEKGTQGNVFLLTAEDGLGDTLKPRLRQAEADMDFVYSNAEYVTFSDPAFEENIKALRPKVIFVDPLQAFLGEHVDMHRANEVRPVFSKLIKLAEEYGFALIILEHMNKNIGTSGLHRGLGSMDITAAARSILLFGQDEDNNQTKGFMHAKSNLAPKGKVMGYKISDTGTAFDPQSEITEDMILGRSSSKGSMGRPSNEVQEAIDFLTEELSTGEIPAKTIWEKSEELGISEKTLKRAKAQLKVSSFRKKENGKDKGWHWSLLDEFDA